MNNLDKKYIDILGDAYKNWKSNGRDFWEEQVDGMFMSELGEEVVDKISKEWFINKIKTDDEFANKWGVKVEIRELSTVRERKKYDRFYDDLIGEYPEHHITLDKRGVPRKLITITYNNQTIEIYEN